MKERIVVLCGFFLAVVGEAAALTPLSKCVVVVVDAV